MKKIIFLEGLPGIGKTTLINEIRNLNIPNVYVVDEIINENLCKNREISQIKINPIIEIKVHF